MQKPHATALLILSASLCCAPLYATPSKQDKRVFGTYQCNGNDPIYGKYRGILTISSTRTQGVYFFNESYPDSNSKNDMGIGFFHKDALMSLFRNNSGVTGVSYDVTYNSKHTLTSTLSSKYLYFDHKNKGFGYESCSRIASS